MPQLYTNCALPVNIDLFDFEIIDSKNLSTAYVILYEWIDLWALDSNRKPGV